MDFPQSRPLVSGPANIAVLPLLGWNSLPTGVAWPEANLAIYLPVRIQSPVTVYKITIGCSGTAGGNFDVGIYDRAGNRRVSSGSTARSASSEVVCDIADTRLGPGLYYAALAADSTDTYVMVTGAGTAPVPTQRARLVGALQESSAFALPATATFAACGYGVLPTMSLHLRSN